MKKLYVGGLSYSTTEDGLRDFFENYGPIVSVRIMVDKFSGQSRGFGFVELEDDAMADAAIAELNGQTLDGKQLKINEARPMESSSRPRSFGDRNSRGNGGGYRGNGRSNFGGRSERRSAW